MGRKVAFPLSSVILAVAAACSNGEGESTPTSTPTFTPKPTTTETFTPTYTSTLIPTETSTPKPPPTSTPRPRAVIPTNTPRPVIRPTQPPQLPPLEVCNTGRFTNPVDGQTVPNRVDVRVQLAHNNDFSKGCLTDGAPNYVFVNAVVIDSYGRRYPWSLSCGFIYPDIKQEEWRCSRDQVILADNPSGNDLELEVDGRVVDGVALDY